MLTSLLKQTVLVRPSAYPNPHRRANCLLWIGEAVLPQIPLNEQGVADPDQQVPLLDLRGTVDVRLSHRRSSR